MNGETVKKSLSNVMYSSGKSLSVQLNKIKIIHPSFNLASAP